MKFLYLILNIGSLSIPFLYSFHPKLQLYKRWKALFLAMIIVTCPYIIWDIAFTKIGVWGFNPDYFTGPTLFNLPIEEWLFFICIPYACVFTHYALLYYFPKWKLSKSQTTVLSLILVFLSSVLLIYNTDKSYTLINFIFFISILSIVLYYQAHLLQQFYITFLVMLIPFFIVNGILTGSFIENEVVWYNNDENLGIRLFTIPIEDSLYAFSLILGNLALSEYFYNKLLTK
jgi:lycopene cyclase domain-containing protein